MLEWARNKAPLFLSYAGADKSIVDAVARELTDAGYAIWHGAENSSHENVNGDANGAIGQSAATIVFWSRNAAQSEWVKDDAINANNRTKLINASLDGTKPAENFETSHAIDFADLRKDTGFMSLTKAIDHHLSENVPTKTEDTPEYSVTSSSPASKQAATTSITQDAPSTEQEIAQTEQSITLNSDDIPRAAAMHYSTGVVGTIIWAVLITFLSAAAAMFLWYFGVHFDP